MLTSEEGAVGNIWT